MTRKKAPNLEVIWRFEDEKGRGPYTSDVAPVWAYGRRHYNPATHPNPAQDVYLADPTWNLAKPILADHPREHWRFGHSSIAQARKWWNLKDLEEAEGYGMHLAAYACRDTKFHADGARQVVFVPKPHAMPILRRPATALWTEPPEALQAEALAQLT